MTSFRLWRVNHTYNCLKEVHPKNVRHRNDTDGKYRNTTGGNCFCGIELTTSHKHKVFKRTPELNLHQPDYYKVTLLYWFWHLVQEHMPHVWSSLSKTQHPLPPPLIQHKLAPGSSVDWRPWVGNLSLSWTRGMSWLGHTVIFSASLWSVLNGRWLEAFTAALSITTNFFPLTLWSITLEDFTDEISLKCWT